MHFQAMTRDVFGMKEGLPPIYSPDCEILILGSFPSVLSRGNFYYANPRNRFWQMLAQVFGEQVPTDIEGRKTFLLAHKIALWDVVKRTEIKGSGDEDLKPTREQINDVAGLIAGGKIRKILLNGGRSAELFSKWLQKDISLPTVKMGSTSTRNFRFDFKEWESQLKDI